MKEVIWSEKKNEWLKAERKISFEVIEQLISDRKILADIDHPNQARYPGQRLFILKYKNYALVVPYKRSQERIILITGYFSRKYTKIYLLNKDNDRVYRRRLKIKR